MINVVSIVIVLFFVFNFYQDVTNRSIYLINLPLSALLILVYAWITNSFVSDIYYLAANISIIIFQVCGAWLFIAVVRKEGSGFLKKYIAFSDIFFLFLPVVIFTPIQLVVFELLILTLSLLISIIKTALSQKLITIPLAGNIGLGLATVIVLEVFVQYPIRNLLIFE